MKIGLLEFLHTCKKSCMDKYRNTQDQYTIFEILDSMSKSQSGTTSWKCFQHRCTWMQECKKYFSFQGTEHEKLRFWWEAGPHLWKLLQPGSTGSRRFCCNKRPINFIRKWRHGDSSTSTSPYAVGCTIDIDRSLDYTVFSSSQPWNQVADLTRQLRAHATQAGDLWTLGQPVEPSCLLTLAMWWWVLPEPLPRSYDSAMMRKKLSLLSFAFQCLKISFAPWGISHKTGVARECLKDQFSYEVWNGFWLVSL